MFTFAPSARSRFDCFSIQILLPWKYHSINKNLKWKIVNVNNRFCRRRRQIKMIGAFLSELVVRMSVQAKQSKANSSLRYMHMISSI